MAEGFELIRTSRLHLRRGAALLDEGRFDDALREVEAALAVDAESLPAQALRQRILAAKSAPGGRGSARLSIAARRSDAPVQPATSFVPHGVNAASWRGFEQRIAERRFRALLDTVNTSIVAGDTTAARVALDEARTLKPDAPELAGFEARVAALPVPVPAAAGVPAARIWMRAMGAAAMFLVGVSLLMGLDQLQLSDAEAPAGPALVEPPAPPPFLARDPADGRGPTADPLVEPESIPAIVTPPEPLQPRGTNGSSIPPTETRPVARDDVAGTAGPPGRPASRMASTVVDGPERPAIREVTDDFVSGRDPLPVETVARSEPLVPIVDAPRPAPSETAPAPVPETPSVENAALPPSAAAAVVPAGSPPVEQGRVEQALRRYARAYGDLNASAARAVWPNVDEKALARAFQDLASQDVSFDQCDIDIRGDRANASCRGQQSYTVKIGSREPRIEPRAWQFELRRTGQAWTIESAEARRLSPVASYRGRR